MGLGHSPSIVMDGLVFSIDAGNSRCYSGNGSSAFGLIGGIGSTLINGVGFTSSNNGSFIFDGANDYINVGNNSALGITNNITIITYFKYTSFDKQWQSIIVKGDNSYRLHRYSVTNQISFGINQAGGQDNLTTTNFISNRWYFLAATFSLPDVKLYVNGVLDATSTYSSPIAVSSYDLYIGENAQQPLRFFNGSISQVMIYNRALTAQEIRQNYNATKKRYGL
jgi:hypothetical protein